MPTQRTDRAEVFKEWFMATMEAAAHGTPESIERMAEACMMRDQHLAENGYRFEDE